MNPARLAAAAFAAACISAFAQSPITLYVDATDRDHRVMRVQETIAASPGKLRLAYPQWIPGHHGPTAEANAIAGLVFRAAGRELAWRRDPVDVFAYEIEVPSDASEVSIRFDFLSPLPGSRGRVVMTPTLAAVDWENLILYPVQAKSDDVRVRPSVRFPPGWKAASSLRPASRDGQILAYPEVTLTELVDSPVWGGGFEKRVDLDVPAVPDVAMDIFGDMKDRLRDEPSHVEGLRAMVEQAHKALAGPYFQHYDFLFALDEEASPVALEHLSSTEIRLDPEFFTRWKSFAPSRRVIAHELVHSWIGKKHRPADLATANFNVPMGGTLLWVYEGETDFWSYVLTGRSHLLDSGQEMDSIARTAAIVDARVGRDWRSLQDTTTDPIIGYDGRPRSWSSWQRGFDYYSESVFLWMEVDARLRTLTHGERSMDDFARNFHGELPATGIVTFTYGDVVAALEAIAPGDWGPWLRERLDSKTRAPAAQALRAAGWKVAYTDTQGQYLEDIDSENKGADFSFSIGLSTGKDDVVTFVQWGGPAFRAGLATGGKLLAVNGHAYKKEILKIAIAEARTSGKPIALLVKEGDTYRTVDVAYAGGLRYPHLERIEGTPDLLARLLEPR